jgi:hypothetical protein
LVDRLAPKIDINPGESLRDRENRLRD